VRTLIKAFLMDLETYPAYKDLENKEKLTKKLSSIYSVIDKATKKNVLHKNKAARKKSQLAAQLKQS
jgi:small subunit ribosomal protein S20